MLTSMPRAAAPQRYSAHGHHSPSSPARSSYGQDDAFMCACGRDGRRRTLRRKRAGLAAIAMYGVVSLGLVCAVWTFRARRQGASARGVGGGGRSGGGGSGSVLEDRELMLYQLPSHEEGRRLLSVGGDEWHSRQRRDDHVMSATSSAESAFGASSSSSAPSISAEAVPLHSREKAPRLNFCSEANVQELLEGETSGSAEPTQLGPNMVVKGNVDEGQYRYFQVCIATWHEHHHSVRIALDVEHGEADIYIDPVHGHPKADQWTWMSADRGSDVITIPTYMDDFVSSGSSVLYIGVRGRGSTSDGAQYSLSVEIEDIDPTEVMHKGRKPPLLRGRRVMPPLYAG